MRGSRLETAEEFAERMARARAYREGTLEYIRRFYDVPAYRGQCVRLHGRPATIARGSAGGGAYFDLRFEDGTVRNYYHPTSGIEYIAADGSVIPPGPRCPK